MVFFHEGCGDESRKDFLKFLKKTLDFFGGGSTLLPRTHQRFLKGGDIHGSLKGNWNNLFDSTP